MMELKESKFNYKIKTKSNVNLLFNSLSKIILNLEENKDIIEKILMNPNEIYENHELNILKNLIDYGFIVKNNTDENLISNLNYMKTIMDDRLNLTILPTEQCNFRCPYCYEDLKNKNIDCSSEEILCRYITKNIKNFSGINISWFGGEPLLKKDSINRISQNIITVCKNMKKPFNASITTNGFFLDLDTFKMLIKNKINIIQVTLDGPKEIHDKIKFLRNGQGSFETVIDNLKNIRDNINSSTFKIIIRTNLTKETLNKLEDYIKLLNHEFGNDNRFSFLFRPVGDWGGNRVKSIKNKLLSSFSDVYKTLINHGVDLNYDISYKLLTNNLCNANLVNSFVINPNLEVFKCTMLFNEEKNKIGYIDKYGNMILDEGKLARWTVKSNLEKEKCTMCKFEPLCNNTICPANRVVMNKEIQCGYEINDIESLFDLLTLKNFNKKYKFIKNIN